MSDELEPVIDFLYNGEAFIAQDYLSTFLGTTKELQIKGLFGDLEGLGEYNQTETEYGNYDNLIDQESILDSLEELDKSKISLVTDNVKPALIPNHELELQIEGIIEKDKGLWRCKVCGKTTTNKGHAKGHAETHIEGVSHACHICRKTVSSRHNLKTHISNIHSGLVSCDVCGKTGMNRMSYRNHKLRNHKVL